MSGDLTLDTLPPAFVGLDQQQQMSENNIANSETPGCTHGAGELRGSAEPGHRRRRPALDDAGR